MQCVFKQFTLKQYIMLTKTAKMSSSYSRVLYVTVNIVFHKIYFLNQEFKETLKQEDDFYAKVITLNNPINIAIVQCKQAHFKELVILKFTRKIVYFVTTSNTYMYCFNFVFLLHSFLFLVLSVSKNPQNTQDFGLRNRYRPMFFYNHLKISILGPE